LSQKIELPSYITRSYKQSLILTTIDGHIFCNANEDFQNQLRNPLKQFFQRSCLPSFQGRGTRILLESHLENRIPDTFSGFCFSYYTSFETMKDSQHLKKVA